MTRHVTPSSGKFQTLCAHPRLHVSADAWLQLASIKTDSWYLPYLQENARLANEALDVQTTMAAFNEHGHNWFLVRARYVQKQTWSLIVQYRLTGEAQYKDAVMAYVKAMHDWEYWSWISWRAKDNNPSALYDLSYGENSATLAIINDWLWNDLTPDDKTLLLATIRRPVDCFLRYFTPASDGSMPAKPWWFGSAMSNWNTVCAGGIGMLALSFYEQLPQAQRIIDLVEESIAPYLNQMVKSQGGWPEGIGYWNFGMRYCFMYLLSHERTTGQKHTGLQQPATLDSLSFPVEFCPNGVPCSFGDVNRWMPLPFHQAVARRLGADDLAGELFRMYPILAPMDGRRTTWPDVAETLLLVRRVITDTQPDAPDEESSTAPFVKLYPDQDWGVIADRAHRPNLYLTMRGGSTTAPHGHIDVSSFHAGVNDESALCSQSVNEYLDTTFSPRRFDLYDTNPDSKNVLLISGAGMVHPSSVITKTIQLTPSIRGLHVDAVGAMGKMRDASCATHYSRAYLMIDNQAILVLDHVILPHEGRLESRLHTPMTITPFMSMAESIESTPARACALQLTGKREKAQLHLASSEPARVYQAVTLSTSPKQDVRVIRWIGDELYTRIVFATLLLPGALPADGKPACTVTADADSQGVDVQLHLPSGEQTLKLNTMMDALR